MARYEKNGSHEGQRRDGIPQQPVVGHDGFDLLVGQGHEFRRGPFAGEGGAQREQACDEEECPGKQASSRPPLRCEKGDEDERQPEEPEADRQVCGRRVQGVGRFENSSQIHQFAFREWTLVT